MLGVAVEDLPERAARLAKVLGEEFHGCAQMTLKALQEVFGPADVEVFKAASPLSGGIARSGQTCGSLLGALLFIGVVFGRRRLERTDVSEEYRRAMEVAERVYDGFEKKFGATICKEIHERLFGRIYNLRDPRDVEEFISSGAPRSCPRPPRMPLGMS
jgi:C_GCAxxG_C_C family probable redox protein